MEYTVLHTLAMAALGLAGAVLYVKVLSRMIFG